jgi:hypothetical protein
MMATVISVLAIIGENICARPIVETPRIIERIELTSISIYLSISPKYFSGPLSIWQCDLRIAMYERVPDLDQ